MNTNRHPVYKQQGRWLNTRGKRELRRWLRVCDRMIFKQFPTMPVVHRMDMVLQSELHAQAERHALWVAPIKITFTSDNT